MRRVLIASTVFRTLFTLTVQSHFFCFDAGILLHHLLVRRLPVVIVAFLGSCLAYQIAER